LYQEEATSRAKSSQATPLTMAEKWCMERGIFTDDVQESLYQRLMNEKSGGKPGKSPKKVKKE